MPLDALDALLVVLEAVALEVVGTAAVRLFLKNCAVLYAKMVSCFSMKAVMYF